MFAHLIRMEISLGVEFGQSSRERAFLTPIILDAAQLEKLLTDFEEGWFLKTHDKKVPN